MVEYVYFAAAKEIYKSLVIFISLLDYYIFSQSSWNVEMLKPHYTRVGFYHKI